MPELPEVETVRRGLEPVTAGARIMSVKLARDGLRFPFPEDFAGRLAGQTVTALARRAKYLLFHLDGGAAIISHLGMSGSYRVEDKGVAEGAFHHERGKDTRHDHVRFDLVTADGRNTALVYNDPRRFGFMLLAEGAALDLHPLLRDLGEEPLGNVLGGERLQALFAGKKAPLKAALLDQRLVAGLGNIYVCEALHRCRLSPERPAGSLSRKGRAAREEADRLASAIRDVIAEAIAAGGSSLRDYVHTDGTLGYFQHRFAVYDREGDPCPAPGCGGTVERIVQSGRSTFFCRRCQR